MKVRITIKDVISKIKSIIESDELSSDGMIAEIGETLNTYEFTTNKNTAPLYELGDNINTLSVKEVADQLMNSRLDIGEEVGDIRLECGSDLEIDILLYGKFDRTEYFSLADIRDNFTEGADWYTWAKTEDGEDVLICFQ